MPPVQYDFNGLANALNNFTGTMTGILDRQAKEQARADLLNMQANFELESNRFMNNLRNTGSYENWEKDYNDFIQKQGDLMQKQSRNQYTAKAAQEMLLGYSVNMRRNVENQVYEMRNKDIMNSYENTAKLVMQNDGFNSEEKINRVSDIYNREIINGKIDRQMYEAKLANAYSNVYLDHYKNYVSEEYIFNALKDGKTLEQLYSELDKDTFELSLRAVDNANTTIEDYENGNAAFTDITNLIDKNKLKESVKDTMRKTYKLSEQQLQKDNDNYFSQEYGKLFTPGMSLIEQVRFCEIAISKLNNQYTGNLMTSDDRKKWVDAFSRFKSMLEKGGESGTSGNGGSAKLPYLKEMIKFAPDTLLQQVNSGEMPDLETAVAVFENELYEMYFSKDWAETQNLSEEDRKKYWENNYKEWGRNNILNAPTLKKIFDSEPRFNGLKINYYSLIKDFEKNPDKYSPDTAKVLSEFLVKFVATSGGTFTDDDLKICDSMLNSCRLDNLKQLSKGNLGKRLEKSISNDVLFTTLNGEELTTSDNKKRLDELNTDLIKEFKKQTGQDIEFHGYEQTKNDVKPIPHFWNRETNTEVIAQPVYDEKGKPTGKVEFVDVNGKKIENTRKEVAQKEREAINEERAKAKEQKQETKQQQATREQQEKKRDNAAFDYARKLNSGGKNTAEYKEYWEWYTKNIKRVGHLRSFESYMQFYKEKHPISEFE